MSLLRARCSHVCAGVVCIAIGLFLSVQVHAQGTGGRILKTSLSHEDEAKLQAALDSAKQASV